MIDTVVLTLREHMFRITNHNAFEPSTAGLYNNHYSLGGRGYMYCKQNPTKSELKNSIYKPRLTVTRRIYKSIPQIMMKIEFSAPKLLYKNNFEELEEKDFPEIIEQLKFRLSQMDVLVNTNYLINADVSSIHYSKNIPLTDGSLPAMYINELSKASISRVYDVNRTDFRNGGTSYKVHTNSFEVTFYDKFKDLQQATLSEKRAEETDNLIQLELFNSVDENKKKNKSNLELLRVEVRINDRRKMGRLFKETGFLVDPTFVNLFKENIAKKVLLNQLDVFENSYPEVHKTSHFSIDSFLAQMAVDNPKATLLQLYACVGLKQVEEDIGVRKAREILQSKDKGFYSFMKKMDSLTHCKDYSRMFHPIRKVLTDFKPVKSIDFPELMLNNDKYDYL